MNVNTVLEQERVPMEKIHHLVMPVLKEMNYGFGSFPNNMA